MTGKILKGVGGFYYVYADDSKIYECRARGIFRNKKMKPCVGDTVEIDVISQDDLTGNLVKIHPRKNQLIRPLATNVDQALVLFAIHEPEPDFHLLDRFVIMMEQQEIPVILCFNKMDLAREGEQEQITQDYRNSGVKVVFESTKTQEGIEELKQMLIGKTTVMAGPSGVGKSSTLNCLGADKTMETGKVSQKIKRGRHTTRHSELIRVMDDTYLMDTPGFSSLYLAGIEKEDLRFYFPEFEPYENRCRFNGCVHIHEPDCAVREALEKGEISQRRYDDYCLFYEELSQIKKW
ncbi:MAG: ribosome small subunit-dependent GTPase A [Lachnospiraceae bacterium]|nr:ribosome small subunit-dependent GTPase A [Lachnospiraceae bacterium]